MAKKIENKIIKLFSIKIISGKNADQSKLPVYQQ